MFPVISGDVPSVTWAYLNGQNTDSNASVYTYSNQFSLAAGERVVICVGWTTNNNRDITSVQIGQTGGTLFTCTQRVYVRNGDPDLGVAIYDYDMAADNDIDVRVTFNATLGVQGSFMYAAYKVGSAVFARNDTGGGVGDPISSNISVNKGEALFMQGTYEDDFFPEAPSLGGVTEYKTAAASPLGGFGSGAASIAASGSRNYSISATYQVGANICAAAYKHG